MYKDSVVARARKRRPTPNSNDDSCFSEDNDGRGKMPANNKGKASQHITQNKKQKKEKKKTGGTALIDWCRYVKG